MLPEMMESNLLRVSALAGGACRLWGARESKQSAAGQRVNDHTAEGRTFPVRGGGIPKQGEMLLERRWQATS